MSKQKGSEGTGATRNTRDRQMQEAAQRWKSWLSRDSHGQKRGVPVVTSRPVEEDSAPQPQPRYPVPKASPRPVVIRATLVRRDAKVSVGRALLEAQKVAGEQIEVQTTVVRSFEDGPVVVHKLPEGYDPFAI